MSTACAILAAGRSSRLGQPKQLLELADGRSLIRHVAETVKSSRAQPVAAIVGAHAAAVTDRLQGLALTVVPSESPAEGVAASIRAAVAWASRQSVDSLLFCVCDQPLLTASHLDALISIFEQERCLAASFYAGRPAVPALFPASYFKQLSQLKGDVGAGEILRQAPQLALVAWPEGEQDVDAPEDVARLARAARQLRSHAALPP
jgi:molybdenum cofactor cytidylyltransferase